MVKLMLVHMAFRFSSWISTVIRTLLLSFARRVKYKEIKTTTLLSPGSKRNKVINTYINYSNLEFDSGESYAKLKVKADLPEGFTLFDEDIEVGHSIKFNVPADTVDAIIDVIIYVEETLCNETEVHFIPIFLKVTDKEFIEQLNQRFADGLEDNPLLINLSELDIVGVTEIFNNNDSLFELKYRRKNVCLSHLDSKRIIDFIQTCDLSLYEGLEKVNVSSYYNGTPVRTEKLYNLVDYIDDGRRCILSKGSWYYFNDDYLEYLAGSLAEIDVVYDSRFDYNSTLYEQFITEMYEKEKDNVEYTGLDENKIKNKLRKKYYRERAFNMDISNKFRFECYDRVETKVGGSKIEIMDLYKDETLYAVKIGDASSVLCYAVDQSINTMKMYKHKMLENLPKVKRFSVWVLLDRRTRLDTINGKPDINQLEMLAFKNKLDAWKKEVRVMGYTPIIMLNYFNCSD